MKLTPLPPTSSKPTIGIGCIKGDIDIVYGTKGAGKSALYALLLSKNGDLFDKNILLIAAENLREVLI